MSKNKDTKKGLALGAIFGLIAGLFSAMPASAAPSTTAFTFDPAGAGTSFVTFVDEDFTVNVQRDPSVIDATDFADLKYEITTDRTWNSTFSVQVFAGTGENAVPMSTAPTVDAGGNAISGLTRAQTEYGNQLMYYQGIAANATTIPATVTDPANSVVKPATDSYVVDPATTSAVTQNQISVRLVGTATEYLSSISPNVTVTIRPFIDLNRNNKFDSASEPSSVQTVSFRNYASLAGSVSVTKGTSGDLHVTASATLPAMNYGQLSGKFFIKWNYAGMVSSTSGIGKSANAERTITDANYLTALSASLKVTAAELGASWSATIGYVKDGLLGGNSANDGGDIDFDLRTWTTGTAAAITRTTNDVRIFTSNGAHQNDTGAVRPNQTYTVTVGARSTSPHVGAGAAKSISAAITLTFGGTSLSTAKTLKVGSGIAATTSHGPVTVTTDATTGLAHVTLVASGYGVGETITVTASQVGTAARGVVLTMTTPAYTFTNGSDLYSTTPGTAVDVKVTVKDQWAQLSTRTDQQVWFTKAAPFDDANTVSKVALVNGVATATLTPSPATKTGSFTVTADLKTLNQVTGLYDDSISHTDDADGMEVFVTGAANGFREGLAASYSASISYGTDLSWSSTINAAYVVITGSQVVVSGAGLMFRDGNDATNTASDSLVLTGDAAGRVQFEVTARLAGTYTVTLTAGSATTTSLIVVNTARSDMGTTITWDTTAIEAGRTKIVVGTLKDANGNPVYTDGPGGDQAGATTASILVTYAGTAGIPVGSMPTETDADGMFRVSILTSGSDDGSFDLTAVYSPYGTATATVDKVTSVNSITVGDNVVAADQKITVGSFKGYIAIYTKGYMGQKLSAKVAGKWLVVDPIAAWQGNDYSRVVRLTGAGYTILVHLYIDGAFVRSETIVTK